MQNYKEPLNLNESYSFNVLVKDKDSNFAGKLVLSPDGCTLTVMGERKFSATFYSSQLIECIAHRNHFYLSNISKSGSRTVNLRQSDYQNQGIFYELKFKVGFVIKTSWPLSTPKFSLISIEGLCCTKIS